MVDATFVLNLSNEGLRLLPSNATTPSQLEYRSAGWRRDRTLAMASEGGKSGHSHRLCQGGVWDFPSGRTRHLDRETFTSPPTLVIVGPSFNALALVLAPISKKHRGSRF